MDQVWADAFVEEGNLKATVSMIRRALGDGTNGQHYIETVPRRGYRFIAPVTKTSDDTVEDKSEPADADAVAVDTIVETIEAEPEEDIAPRKFVRTRRYIWPLVAVCGALAGLLILLVTAHLRAKRVEQTPAENPEQIKTIAILPFKSLVAANGDKYLELGLADSLITKLSAVNQITVRPISAVRKYNGAEQDAVTAGRELDVEMVLEGNMQRLNDRIRVTARLMRVSNGAPLWADQFDEKLTDIFAVEDAISQRVANALALHLNSEESARLTKRSTQNSEAYENYLEGRYFWNKRTSEGNEKAIKYFGKAINLDSHYALAYTGLADCYNMMGYWNLTPPRESFPKAKAAAIKALEIDDRLAEAHASLAYAEFEYDWDFERAENGYKRAVELNPNYATAHQWYAEYLMVTGQLNASESELRRAQQLEPLSMPIRMLVASKAYEIDHQNERAIEQLQQMIEIDPGFTPAYHLLGTCYREKGMNDEAVAAWLKGASLEGASPETIEKMQRAYTGAGLQGYLRQEVETLVEESRRHYISPIFIAMDYALLNDRTRAFAWLNKAYEERSGWILELKFDPVWDNLRPDARFHAQVRRIGLGQ